METPLNPVEAQSALSLNRNEEHISNDLLELFQCTWPGWRAFDVQGLKLRKTRERFWKNVYDKFVCLRCGNCCKTTQWAATPRVRTATGELLQSSPSEILRLVKEGQDLSAARTGSYLTWEDICRWRKEGREDILRFVYVFEGYGGIMFDRSKNTILEGCPFLKGDVEGRHSCAIYATRPQVCTAYPLYYDNADLCPYCGASVRYDMFSCPGCGYVLVFDPRAMLECPGVGRVLESLPGVNRPCQPFSESSSRV